MVFRKTLLFAGSSVCLFAASFLPAHAQSPKTRKPNIIFVLTDDLGYGDLGVFFQNGRKASGDRSKPFQLTPQLDQLAKEGAQFTQQYSNAPVCAPSRASLLTGVHQGNAHVRDNQFDKALEENHTVSSLLKQAGYHTVAIGKWGLQGEKEEAPNWPAHPLKRGFDQYFGYMRHADGHEHYPVEGLYRGKKQVWQDYQNVAAGLDKCYTTDLWTAYAKKWIVDHQKDKGESPFFMYLAFDAPHAVLELPTQAYPKGGGLHGGLQWLNEPGHMINTASGTVDSYVYPDYAHATYDHDSNAATPEIAWPDTYKRYATATRRIDDAVGDLMQLLRDLNMAENTLVVFTSDNGPSIESYLPAAYVPNHPTFFGSYGPFDGIKRDCWEGGLRMPTIAAWPGHIAPGKVITTPSMLSDWLPTFAEMAQLPAPARTDGVSLLPSLTGKGKQETSPVYVEYFEGGKTPAFNEFEASRRDRRRAQMQLIRMGDLVGVRYNIRSADDDFEIYDVVNDPKETTNLAGLPRMAAVQQEMKAGVLQRRRADSAARRPYDTAYVPPAFTKGKKVPKKTAWKYFAGDFSFPISISGRMPKTAGAVTTITGKEGSNKNGMIWYETWIHVPADGRYSFSFQSSNKAFVRLHEAALFDADFLYTPNETLQQDVYLQKGDHPVRISLLKNAGQKNSFLLQWKGASSDDWITIGTQGAYR